MKALFTLSIALITTIASAQPKATPTPTPSPSPTPLTYNVDAGESKIAWLGKKITGQHTGTLSVKSGNIVMTNDLITGGEIVVDMNTLAVTDIPAKDEKNGKLVGHLKSADFFDVAKFPLSKIIIKSSKKVAKGLEVTGDLSIKDKTNPVTFVATLTKSDKTITGKSEFKVDRTKFNIKYGSGSFFKGLGDKAIYDEFTLTIDLTAKM